jgi:putative ABC transport system substrate-binding protein
MDVFSFAMHCNAKSCGRWIHGGGGLKLNKNKYLEISSIRRKLVLAGAASSALVWAGAVRAQGSEKIRRIGLLSTISASYPNQWFRQGLRDLGWVEGKNIVIEYRNSEGERQRLPELAAQLVRLKVDVIVTLSPPAGNAAQQATTVIPIVTTFAGDPVVGGRVKNLAPTG